MIEYKVKVFSDRTEWYLNGELHREDGLPAYEWSDGSKAWWLNGKLHREDGPASEYASGYKEWWLNGERHREDGLPAIEWSDGSKYWWVNGKLHREDGPACEYASGYKEWWVNGKQLTEAEFNNSKTKELTVKQIEKLLGYSVKVVK